MCVERNTIKLRGQMMKNIIVTGATSMIGVALIEEAIESNVNVYAIVRPNTNRIERLPKTDLIHIIYANLEDIKNVDVPDTCDVLYHFAWAGATKEQRNDPLLNMQNIEYTIDAIELARKSGCRKFVGAGSQAEYGPVNGRIDVNSKFAPVLPYGVCKYAAGKLAKRVCEQYGIICVWGRIFSVYGKWDNENTLLNYAIKQFVKREKACFSSGKQKWNYLYEKDAGKMFFAMGEKVEESTELIVASDETRPLKEFIGILANAMDGKDLCEFAVNDANNIYGIDPDISSTIKVLGINSFTPFDIGSIRMLNL